MPARNTGRVLAAAGVEGDLDRAAAVLQGGQLVEQLPRVGLVAGRGERRRRDRRVIGPGPVEQALVRRIVRGDLVGAHELQREGDRARVGGSRATEMAATAGLAPLGGARARLGPADLSGQPARLDRPRGTALRRPGTGHRAADAPAMDVAAERRRDRGRDRGRARRVGLREPQQRRRGRADGKGEQSRASAGQARRALVRAGGEIGHSWRWMPATHEVNVLSSVSVVRR